MDIQPDYPYSHPFPPYGFSNGVPADQAAAHQMALYSYQLSVEHLQPVSSASTVAAVAGMTMDAPLPVVSVSDSGGDSDDFSPDSATVDSNLMDAAIRDLADATAAGAAVSCDMGHDALRAATESSPEGDEDESSHLDFAGQDGSVGAGASSAGGNGTGTGTSVKKKRRGRVRFTDRQIETLEQRFIQDQYLPALERTHLASMVGLNESQVKTWFQNRRAKSKRAAKRKARAAAAHLASQQQQQQQGTGLALGTRNAATVPAASVSTYNAVSNAAYNSAAFNASAAIQYQASQQAAAAAAALHMNAYAQPYATTAMLNGMAAAVPGNSASSAAAYAQPYAAAAAAAAAAAGAPASAINMGNSPTYQSASQLAFGSGNPSVPFDTSVPTSQSAYSLFSDPHSSASLPDYYRFLGTNPSGVPL